MPNHPKTAANVKRAVPFFAVSNIDASVRYDKSLGFEMTKEWMGNVFQSCVVDREV